MMKCGRPKTGPRPHWRKFMGAFEKLGLPELSARRDVAARILREHGVTYNIYGDTRGQGRPWALDLAPLIIPRTNGGSWKPAWRSAPGC